MDVVLDGHKHRVISDSLVKNKDGHPVLLASRGEHFVYAGVLDLSKEGTFSFSLVPLGNVLPDAEVPVYVELLEG